MAKSADLHLDSVPENRLFIKQWTAENSAVPVLLVHGSVENGTIFYSKSGKGFAPWLADKGYNVYVPDLRGRGKSTPAITKNSNFGQMDMINTDLPELVKFVLNNSGKDRLFIGAHSWGGNLLLAALARFPELAPKVRGMVFFGTKRRVSVWNWERIYKLNFFWRTMAPIKIYQNGYLPAKGTVFGDDNETKLLFEETNFWLDDKNWTDPRDGFDFGAALRKMDIPPILSITGTADKVLGHPIDCQLVLEETGSTNWEFQEIGRKQGFKHDYDHINLLTHRDAVKDHFPMIADWMAGR